MRISFSLAGITLVAGVAGIAACGSKATTAATPCALSKADSGYVQPERPVYRDCAVDRKARLASRGVHPDFTGATTPSRGTQCHSVDLEFVVDTRGVPEGGTARVVRTNDPEFADAWLKVVPALKYDPAMVGTTPVRQIVNEHFTAVSGTVVVKMGSGLPSSPPRDMPPPNC
jgi:hypothetical protein